MMKKIVTILQKYGLTEQYYNIICKLQGKIKRCSYES